MDGTSGVGATTTMRPHWIVEDVVGVPRVKHDLLKSLEKFIPIFDLDNKEDALEDHISIFMLFLHLMNVEHEDVLC